MVNSFVLISLSDNKLTSSKHSKHRWLWIRVTSWGLNGKPFITSFISQQIQKRLRFTPQGHVSNPDWVPATLSMIVVLISQTDSTKVWSVFLGSLLMVATAQLKSHRFFSLEFIRMVDTAVVCRSQWALLILSVVLVTPQNLFVICCLHIWAPCAWNIHRRICPCPFLSGFRGYCSLFRTTTPQEKT